MQITSEMLDLFSKEQLKSIANNTETIEQVCKRTYPTALINTSFEQYVDFDTLDNSDWVEVLRKHPHLIDKCTHAKQMSVGYISLILSHQPQLAEHFELDELRSDDVFNLLMACPQFHDKVDLTKLTCGQWEFLKKGHPNYEPFKGKKPVNSEDTQPNVLLHWDSSLYFFYSEDLSYDCLQTTAYDMITQQWSDNNPQDLVQHMTEYDDSNVFIVVDRKHMDMLMATYNYYNDSDEMFIMGQTLTIWHMAKLLSTQIITK